jgi:hypothetical protein
MQETLQDWQPIYEGAPPLAWEARLLLLCRLLVCVFLFLRGMSLIRTLWRIGEPLAPQEHVNLTPTAGAPCRLR